jgi:hypothetical protein
MRLNLLPVLPARFARQTFVIANEKVPATGEESLRLCGSA